MRPTGAPLLGATRALIAAAAAGLVLAGCGDDRDPARLAPRRTPGPAAPRPAVTPVPGVRDDLAAARRSRPRRGRFPPPADPRNVYAAARAGRLSSAVRGQRALVYVPVSGADAVTVISQRTRRVIRRFPVAGLPQHVVPAWNLRRLWVNDNTGNLLTPIDPRTGRPGRPRRVDDPYNLYFVPDGRLAIVVAERERRLDFRTPGTMRVRDSISVPGCAGINHMDFTPGGRRALVSCEFSGRLIVVDVARRRLLKTVDLPAGAMPQDVRIARDGRRFYVADLAAGGVWTIGARRWRRRGFLRTGAGAHGLYPSRDARSLYVTNRSAGSVSVISMRRGRVRRTWQLPGRASPDMGGVSANGRVLWLSGRYDGAVYAISTRTGRLLRRIPVGPGPHGLSVWPQPGRYSLGHTGILR